MFTGIPSIAFPLESVMTICTPTILEHQLNVSSQIFPYQIKYHYDGNKNDYVHYCLALVRYRNLRYHGTHGITNAYGQYIISNAQAYANFIVTANQPNSTQYQSEWSSAQGSTSTTLFSGGFVNLTLQSVSSSSCGSVCSSTCLCLSGYTCTNGMCVQNSKSNTILNFSILDIIIVIAVIMVVFIVVTRFKK